MPNLERVCSQNPIRDRGWARGVETGRVFVRQKRSPARKPKGKAKAKPKARKAAKSGGGFSLFDGIEQRHLDLIGLFLVAAGIYLVFVLFFGWEGGKVGYGIETGLVYLFGSFGARIFALLMLIAGGMLLTGTSVSALARGIGRGIKFFFFGGMKASEPTARPARQSSEEWRQRRDERTAVTKEARTDVMRDYPEDDDVEPTVALADTDDDIFAPGLFNFDDGDAEQETAETQVVAAEPEPDPEPDEPEPGPIQQLFTPEPQEVAPKPSTPMGNLR